MTESMPHTITPEKNLPTDRLNLLRSKFALIPKVEALGKTEVITSINNLAQMPLTDSLKSGTEANKAVSVLKGLHRLPPDQMQAALKQLR